MKLLHSNFYIIAMLRVRMREIHQTWKKNFKILKEKVAQMKRNILTLTSLHCRRSPAISVQEKKFKVCQLDTSSSLTQQHLESFLLVYFDVGVGYSQGREKASTASGKIHKQFLVEKRQQDLPQISMTSTSLLMRKFQLSRVVKSLLTGLRVAELHKRNRKREIPEWCHKCTDPWPLCFP